MIPVSCEQRTQRNMARAGRHEALNTAAEIYERLQRSQRPRRYHFFFRGAAAAGADAASAYACALFLTSVSYLAGVFSSSCAGACCAGDSKLGVSSSSCRPSRICGIVIAGVQSFSGSSSDRQTCPQGKMLG